MASDNMCEFRNESRQCFLSNTAGRELLMNDEERLFLEQLEGEFIIYRGMTVQEFESGIWGISWTLDLEIAEFFAFEYSRNFKTNGEEKKVYSVKISKTEAICYLNGRGESEIIFANTSNHVGLANPIERNL